MTDWFILTIIALFCYGLQNFLYKVSAEEKCNTAWTTFSFMITVAFFSSILFFVLKESIGNLYFLLIIAFLNAVTFLITTITRIEALKHVATSVAYPIIRIGLVLVVIFSIFYFKDSLSIYQGLGIILAIFVILILVRQSSEEKIIQKNFKLGIALVFIALLSSVATTIIIKFAAIQVNKLAFIAISYIYNTFFTLGLRNKLQTKDENPKHKNALIIGFLIGLVNFVGFYVLLKALSTGPLSIIASISSLSFVIAILLSILIYKEKITSKRVVGVLLTIGAILLMRI